MIANERRNKTPLPEIAPFDDFIADDKLIGMWQSSNPTKFIFFEGKDTDNIRGYIVFGDGKADMFLPVFHKTRPSPSWAEISDCLIDTYTDVTGKTFDGELRRIPI